MLDVFLDVIAPVLVMAALGGFVGRRFGVPAEVVSNLSFNLFGPALGDLLAVMQNADPVA